MYLFILMLLYIVFDSTLFYFLGDLETIILSDIPFTFFYKTNDATHNGGVICIRIICALVKGFRIYITPISAYEGPYTFV